LHQQQLHEGQDYLELRPTVSISFLNHVMFPQVPDYHLRFRLLEQAHHFPLTDGMEFHIIELPKFTKSATQLETTLDVWLYFLRHAATMNTDALPVALQQQPLVLQAVEELQMVTQTDEERERYESRRKAHLDYNTGMKLARMEGRVEGEKVGLIHSFEQLLNLPETPADQLMSLSIDDLSRLAADLHARVLKQR
jgi:predicted transposase/invertase (TIGR01784 family)